MTFKPSIDMPEYKTWTHDQLARVAAHYHQMLVEMRETIEKLRLDLKSKEENK